MSIFKILAAALHVALAKSSKVGIFEMFEGMLESSAPAHSNPFQVGVDVVITGPAESRHPTMTVAAFFDGAGTWRFRFAPDAIGKWHWRSASNIYSAGAESFYPSAINSTVGNPVFDTSLDNQMGVVHCKNGTSKGGVIVDPKNPHHMIYEDGSRHLLVGYEADWLWALGLDDDTSGGPSVDDLVAKATGLGMNHFVVNIFSNFSGWNEPLPDRVSPKVAPTSSTPWIGEARDQFNLEFFQHYDSMLRTLDAHGATAHVMFYVGNKNVQWAGENSTEDEMYWRYCMARFAAFPNIVLDVSKEASHYGVGVGFIASRLRLMNALNAHGRIVTAHAGQWGDSDCPEESGCDMISRQSHFENPADFYQDTIDTRDRNPHAPMFNIESLYEAGPVRGCAGAPNFTYPLCGGAKSEYCFATGGTPDNLCVDFSTLRTTFWDIYMAGGYGAWYSCDTAWDVITTGEPSEGHLDVGRLVGFWKGVHWWTMDPRDDLLQSPDAVAHCLAKEGEEYVIYSHGGAAFSVDLLGGSALRGTWYSPSTGTSQPLDGAGSLSGRQTFTPPPGLARPDVVLHLVKDSSLLVV